MAKGAFLGPGRGGVPEFRNERFQGYGRESGGGWEGVGRGNRGVCNNRALASPRAGDRVGVSMWPTKGRVGLGGPRWALAGRVQGERRLRAAPCERRRYPQGTAL